MYHIYFEEPFEITEEEKETLERELAEYEEEC